MSYNRYHLLLNSIISLALFQILINVVLAHDLQNKTFDEADPYNFKSKYTSVYHTPSDNRRISIMLGNSQSRGDGSGTRKNIVNIIRNARLKGQGTYSPNLIIYI